jgi:hypothetical protein
MYYDLGYNIQDSTTVIIYCDIFLRLIIYHFISIFLYVHVCKYVILGFRYEMDVCMNKTNT